jgi:hypothetical protein
MLLLPGLTSQSSTRNQKQLFAAVIAPSCHFQFGSFTRFVAAMEVSPERR